MRMNQTENKIREVHQLQNLSEEAEQEAERRPYYAAKTGVGR